jgi:aldehyde:ferredoxin oxidoreductase
VYKRQGCDGLNLEWGNAPAVLELIRKIAYRDGFGSILGEGCAHAAELMGKGEYYAIHIKGQDLYESIRPYIGWGLGACVSTRGGGHTTGGPHSEFNGSEKDRDIALKVYEVETFADPLTYEGKAKLVAVYEVLHKINNSIGLCHFVTAASYPTLIGLPEIAELYSAATGWETSVDDLKRAATRMLNIEKAFNVLHANLGRKDDYPPPRVLTEPVPTGSIKGLKLDKQKWDKLLDEYYELHNWDVKTGIPTRECLEELGLNGVADDIENYLRKTT